MTVDRIVKGHDLFGSLSVEETNKLSRFSATKKYKAGEKIFQYGVNASHVFMLMNGSVNLQLPASPPDFSLVISKVQKGELFGVSPLLDSPRYTSTAECADDSEVLVIEARPLREMLRTNCPVGFVIMSQVAHAYFNRYIDVLKNLQKVVSQIPLIH